MVFGWDGKGVLRQRVYIGDALQIQVLDVLTLVSFVQAAPLASLLLGPGREVESEELRWRRALIHPRPLVTGATVRKIIASTST